MSENFFEEDLNNIQAECEKILLDWDLMCRNAIDDEIRKQAEWRLKAFGTRIGENVGFLGDLRGVEPMAAEANFLAQKFPFHCIDERLDKLLAPRAAEIEELKGACPSFQMASVEEELARLFTPRAVELEQPLAAVATYSKKYR